MFTRKSRGYVPPAGYVSWEWSTVTRTVAAKVTGTPNVTITKQQKRNVIKPVVLLFFLFNKSSLFTDDLFPAFHQSGLR